MTNRDHYPRQTEGTRLIPETVPLEQPIDQALVDTYYSELEGLFPSHSAHLDGGSRTGEIRTFLDQEHAPRELQAAAVRLILSEKHNIKNVLLIQRYLELPPEVVQTVIEELQPSMKRYLVNFSSNFLKDGIEILDNFPLLQDFWQSEEVQLGLKSHFDYFFHTGPEKREINFESIRRTIDEQLPRLVNVIFPDSKLFTDDEQVQSKAKSIIKSIIDHSLGGYDFSLEKLLLAIDAASFFSIDIQDPSIQTFVPEIEKKLLDFVRHRLTSWGLPDKNEFKKVFRIRDTYGLSKELGKDIAKESMFMQIPHGGYGSWEVVKKIKEIFEFPDSINADLFDAAQKEEKWDKVIGLANYFPECEELYRKVLAKGREIISISQNARERKEVIDMFAGLIINGDTQFLPDLVGIVSERSQDRASQETKTGLTPLQEAAFAVLRKLDMPESNAALYSLLGNESIPPVVKRSTLTKLTEDSSSFLDEHSRYDLRQWLHSAKLEELNWDDLSFFDAIEKISASESRGVARLYAGEVIAGFSVNGESAYDVWQQYPDIPKDTFLQLCKFLQADPRQRSGGSYYWVGVMEQFQVMYKTLRKEGSRRDVLLSAIASCHTVRPELLEVVVEKLSKIHFESKEDADKLTRILKLVSFLDSIQIILSQGNYNEHEEDGEYDNEEVSQTTPTSDMEDIFLREVEDVSELEDLLSEAATVQVREILPNEKITAEKVEKVTEQWADIEPIFTYVRRHPELREYIAEMFAHFDSTEDWKAWRYGDTGNEIVAEQIGFLSSEQLQIWKTDYAAEVGDFEVQEGSLGKPDQVRRLLVDAIVRDRHIDNEQAGGARFPFTQRILEHAFGGFDENIEEGRKKIFESLEKINDLASKLDILILSANSPRVEQMLSTTLPLDRDITPSSRIENVLKALRPFLPSEVFEAVWQTYRTIPEKTSILGSQLIPSDVRHVLIERLQDLTRQADETVKSSVLQELGLATSSHLEISAVYQKRAELKAVQDVLRLADLSPRQIALNVLVEGRKKDEGASITSALESVKKFFKDSAFAQDIKNVEFILKEQTQFAGKRRLAMVFTDDPSFLWQAGKYPIGNGSCQHYAEGGMSQSLMGYVGDAHIKVAYLFDINSLPESLRERVKEGTSLAEVVQQAKPLEILQAVVARSIVKLGRDQRNNPSIFMEPTYSVINKGDASMDKYFSLFADLFVVEPMQAALYRGGGKEKLYVPKSRNPAGQYEDGAEGNAGHAGMGIQTSRYTISAKLITNDHAPSAEEEKVIEHMRRSSYALEDSVRW